MYEEYPLDCEKTYEHLLNAERWYERHIVKYERRLKAIRSELKRRQSVCDYCGRRKKGCCR